MSQLLLLFVMYQVHLCRAKVAAHSCHFYNQVESKSTCLVSLCHLFVVKVYLNFFNVLFSSQ